MPKVALYNMQGASVGEIELNDETFGAPINVPAMHLVVRSQLAAKRQGTQSTLTRAEVRGGGKKPWRQKGLGRARQGSTRSPQWRTGGVVFAPKPRDYVISVPRKVRRLALKSALTSKVIDGDIIVLDELSISQPKTKLVAEMLKNLKIQGRALLVLPGPDTDITRASRNIEGLTTIYVNTLNVYDILGNAKFIITQEAVRKVEEVYV